MWKTIPKFSEVLTLDAFVPSQKVKAWASRMGLALPVIPKYPSLAHLEEEFWLHPTLVQGSSKGLTWHPS